MGEHDYEPCSSPQHYFEVVLRTASSEIWVTESGDLLLYQRCVNCGLFIEEPVTRTPVDRIFHSSETGVPDGEPGRPE